MEAFLMFLGVLGIFIQYFIIKLAIKNAFKESSGEIKRAIEKGVADALEQHRWKQENKS